ncbi:FAD-dependent oxidoreductase [Sphingobacterium hungaricum]|uniref:Xanthan lyase n=1 Tax=Sphingobacterium hungaricum TaxID=2082723 RepID=A0A928UWU7_9SPHI|nr:FAD-dependent oxidoreductase [Sphingobacterium hungaricum]MBE8714458.1 xanthan lyase [Sphingobacterium hungaricum]
MKKLMSIAILVLASLTGLKAQQQINVDLCIYGGTSAGIIAAYTASKAGKSVLIIEPSQHLGGLSSGGLGMTDIGNKYVVKGLALDFYRKLGKHYNTFEQWIFEPKVASAIFMDYLKNCDAKVMKGRVLSKVNKNGTTIESVVIHDAEKPTAGQAVVNAKIFMDCTYEGDLFALAGASYHVGREDNAVYGETLNGVQLLDGHQFPNGIDPYVERGNKNSGLLWGINADPVLPKGTGDKKVQAYNYRIALTNVPANRVEITKPENYDPAKYEVLKRQKEIQKWKSLQDVFIWSLMPNGKTDINNRNGFSTDMIGANWAYPEANYEERKKIIKAHEDYTKGLLYFVGNDPAVPEFIRQEMKTWGYPKDEYVDNKNWSPQLYIREARRLVGELVMTQHHCQGREVVADEVGYAAYTMDSHNCDRVVVNGMVKNEGNVEVGGFPPFPISYRAIIPKKNEVSNLIVPVCLSASHIAFGSIRMEPVFMVLGQSGAVAACLAIDQGTDVHAVNVDDIKRILSENPKADHRQADELIHVSDSDLVSLTGNWENGKSKGYGMSYKEADSEATSVAKFNTSKNFKSGKYKLYTYFPKTEASSSTLTINVFNGKDVKSNLVDLNKVEIKGQTTSTWVDLGEYAFDTASDKPYIEISTENTNGTVAANAVLLVPITDQKNK